MRCVYDELSSLLAPREMQLSVSPRASSVLSSSDPHELL